MRKHRNKKSQGNLVVWIFALIFLFTVALVYIIMTKPFITIRDMFEPNFTGTEFEDTFNKINTFWIVWPILVIFGVFLWAILATMQQRPNIPF